MIAAIASVLAPGASETAQEGVGTVRVDTTHVINSFDPDRALGSSLDVLSRRDIDKVFTPHIIEESLSAGWGPITYRNNSELRMAAWHWTENGAWSDAANKSGYFTGSTELKDPLRYILSYSLPHRGFSTSGDRPVQGHTLSYWKSNPYLTSKFTGESDALHPQWVVVDLKSVKPVSAVQIVWASPYATKYQVQYWVGSDALDFDEGPKGEWKTFPSGDFKNAQGGTVTLPMSPTPVSSRFLRIWMTESSNTCDVHGSGDIRNCVGYAIQEIHAGSIGAGGAFLDVMQGATGRNAPWYCSSSIDPWHSAADANTSGGGQHSGFDIFFTSGYTAFYWAAHMINLEWVAHRSGTHQMVATTSNIKDSEGNMLVTSYAVHRPDGNWSVMLVNRDETNPHRVRIAFEGGESKGSVSFAGAVRVLTFGSEQYVWTKDGPNSHAEPDGPPVGKTIDAGRDTTFLLPKASITVVRGKVGP